MDIENINAKANAGVTLGTIGTALSGLRHSVVAWEVGSVVMVVEW